MHQQFGRRLADAVVQILQSGDGIEPRLQSPRVGFERVQPLAEQFDLDRLGVACEVVDHVGKNLHELDSEAGDRRDHLVPHVVHHREDVA